MSKVYSMDEIERALELYKVVQFFLKGRKSVELPVVDMDKVHEEKRKEHYICQRCNNSLVYEQCQSLAAMERLLELMKIGVRIGVNEIGNPVVTLDSGEHICAHELSDAILNLKVAER